MRHEAPLVIVADGAGDFAGDEGTKSSEQRRHAEAVLHGG
jgi:hypothetical protein